jgi:hypothetical protein
MAFVFTRSRQALRLEIVYTLLRQKWRFQTFLLRRSVTLIATFLRRVQIAPALCERRLNKMEMKVRVMLSVLADI